MEPVDSDEFQCYDDLAARYTEGVDYAVQVLQREQSRVAILAPHGGRIEGRTSEVARLIAGDEHRLYLFEGLRTTGDNFDCLHLASHRFDEPRALQLIAACDSVVAVHGYASSGPDVLLGGLNETLKRGIAESLAENGFTCELRGTAIPAAIRATFAIADAPAKVCSSSSATNCARRATARDLPKRYGARS